MREQDILLGVIVRGELIDQATTAPPLNCFEDDEPIANAINEDHYIQLTPYSTIFFDLLNIRYRFEAANQVTFRLRLYERYAANQTLLERHRDIVYDSGAGLAPSTDYNVIPGGAAAHVPIPVKLASAGKLYYQIDWSNAPGDTPGFLLVRGRLRGEFERTTWKS